ncbi:MAG TPA: glutathione S-transferase N-terminal domain-containing protein, partial [Paracoccaceae bacterium]|nr:glutathione S-transferase N-terminal domain-containing protein [Paracoccaceae bacterium]
MVTLYDYWRSSAAYRLRIALGLAGLDWTAVPVDLATGENRHADHLARNPQGLVPVVDIDGLRLTQSLAIVEYLDETRALGFLPADPVGRARVRTLAYAVAMEIHPVCNLSVARHAATASGGAITMEGWMHHFIPRGLAAVEALLDHPAAEVRRAALQYYATRGTLRFANSVFRKLDDADDSVRAAAIRAFCTLGQD